MASVAPAQETIPPSLLPIVLDSPAMSTPDGETPNFVNPENLHAVTYATLVLGLFFSTIFLWIRVYTKAFLIRGLSWEDYTAVLSWCLFVAFCAEIFVDTPLIGIHLWDETVGEVINMLYVANTVEILYVPCICLIKVSILLQYLRIFAPSRASNPVMWWCAWFWIVANVIFYIVEMFFDIFTCSPRALTWNPLLNGWCWDVNKILLSVSIFNLISDVAILVLPQFSIWRLHMASKRKLGVSAIFGLGLLACIVTGLRVWSTNELIQTQDASWYLDGLALWAIAEISLAIISSSLPTLPKFLGNVSSRLSTNASSKASYRSSKEHTHLSDSSRENPSRKFIGAMQRVVHWHNEDLDTTFAEAEVESPCSPNSLEHDLERNQPVLSAGYDGHFNYSVVAPPSEIAELDARERVLRSFRIEGGIVPCELQKSRSLVVERSR